MMTSKCHEHSLCSLLFETKPSYSDNLKTLLTLINNATKNTIIVAPELCLTGFDYDNFEDAVAFSDKAIEEIKKASMEKTIILTILERRGEEVFNFAKIFYKGEVVYERAKARLFHFGNEHKYMSEGRDEAFKIVEVNGIKIALLICFELRFKEFWQMSEGADVIAIPAWWGASRRENFKTLTNSLAVMNQCYVIASDSLNAECAQMSGIITPQGEVSRNENRASLCLEYEPKKIALMRRYMDVGIK